FRPERNHQLIGFAAIDEQVSLSHEVREVLVYFFISNLPGVVDAAIQCAVDCEDQVSHVIAALRCVAEEAGPQRPAGPVGADDDARGHSLRADERELAWRGAIRKETFAFA